VAAVVLGEHECAVVGRWSSAIEAGKPFGSGVDERHGADLAGLGRRRGAGRIAGTDPDDMRREVDVAPAQRPQLAHAQPGECRDDEDRGVLVIDGRVSEGIDLLGREDVDVATRRLGVALNLRCRVERQSPDSACPLEDAV
jgi:hypothetical protein